MGYTVRLINYTREHGRCPACGGVFLLRRDGTMRYHGPHWDPCPRNGRPPAGPDQEDPDDGA